MPELTLTDEEIAVKVQKGDVDAFSLLYTRYKPAILRYGKKFLFQYEDVEDAVQEIFIRTYVHIQSFDPSKKFSTWLYRIAHNTFINVIRKKGREPLTFFDLDTFFQLSQTKEPAAERHALQFELQVTMEKHLMELEPKYREPLVLYYFEEKSYKEIADIMHIPVSTVGVRITRAKTLMKGRCKNLPLL